MGLPRVVDQPQHIVYIPKPSHTPINIFQKLNFRTFQELLRGAMHAETYHLGVLNEEILKFRLTLLLLSIRHSQRVVWAYMFWIHMMPARLTTGTVFNAFSQFQL